MKYYSKSDFSRLISVSLATLYLWEQNGKLIPAMVTKTNRKFYSSEQLEKFKRRGELNRRIIGYSRVESSKDMSWQESKIRQLNNYGVKNHYEVEIIADVGSLAEERQGYKEIISLILQKQLMFLLLVREEDLGDGTELEVFKQICSEHGTAIIKL